MNLESLRRKRAKRLGVKATAHTGQRRIYFVLDRATRKFHGDVCLWMQYIDYARKQKSHKKASQILTSVLRLHPTKPELWIYAASYAYDSLGDMTEARSYMQRGLRFCKNSKDLWLEYAKLEMLYLAKISARRKILGIDQSRETAEPIPVANDRDADLLKLPTITADDINPDLQTNNPELQAALSNLDKSPALTGEIPMAIFDAAMECFKDENLGEQFFDLVASFQGLNCSVKLLEHIVKSLLVIQAKSPATLICYIRQPVCDIEAVSPKFPRALSDALSRLKTSIEAVPLMAGLKGTTRPRADLLCRAMKWLLGYLDMRGLDPDVTKALSLTMKRTWNKFCATIQESGGGSAEEVSILIERCRKGNQAEMAASMLAWSVQLWPSEERLKALQETTSSLAIQ